MTATPYLDRLCYDYALIAAARAYGRAGHDSINQVRKYTGKRWLTYREALTESVVPRESVDYRSKDQGALPYWIHTESVAETIARVNGDLEMVIAALFHDLLEDVFPKKPEYNFEEIHSSYGIRVGIMVIDLTDRFTKEAYPELSRAKRKEKEAARIISPEAATIKLADIIDNGIDIEMNDPGFAKTYKKELLAKMPVLSFPAIPGNPELYAEAMSILNNN